MALLRRAASLGTGPARCVNEGGEEEMKGDDAGSPWWEGAKAGEIGRESEREVRKWSREGGVEGGLEVRLEKERREARTHLGPPRKRGSVPPRLC